MGITENVDGKLVVDPKYETEPSAKTVVLEPGHLLGREIIANYLLGVDVIRVHGKEQIQLGDREAIKSAVSGLVGLEIIEEDRSTMVLQCLLEPSGFPPEKILRRAYAIAAGMDRDVFNAFVDGEAQLAKSVMVRDNEVNRLYFLLVRILRTIVQNPGLSEKLGVRPIDCLDYRLVASLVEAIGDECVRIAQKTIELKGAIPSKELDKFFSCFQDICFGAHEKSLDAFLRGDISLAEKVRNLRKDVEKEFASIEGLAQAQSIEIVPRILAVASFMRQIYEHSVDISDLAVRRNSVV